MTECYNTISLKAYLKIKHLVVQCSACGLKVASLILANGSFLMREIALINPSRTIWSIAMYLVLVVKVMGEHNMKPEHK